jgi:hypothetical protein
MNPFGVHLAHEGSIVLFSSRKLCTETGKSQTSTHSVHSSVADYELYLSTPFTSCSLIRLSD